MNRSKAQSEKDYVPGPRDEVTLDSPYGFMSYSRRELYPDHRLDNGAKGTIERMNPDGSAIVNFRQGPRLAVPIHWLAHLPTTHKGNQAR